MWSLRPVDPIGQIVGVGIRRVEEAPVLEHGLERIDRVAAGIPAERPLAGCLGMQADRLSEMGALLVLGDVFIVDPFEAVARDFPARFPHRRDCLGGALERSRDTEHGHRHVAVREQPPKPPKSRARAVFVHRFDVHVALPRPGLRAKHVREKRLRGGIAMQDIVLSTLLVIDHELDGDARAARPAWVGRIAAVSREIAGIRRDVGRAHGPSYTSSAKPCLARAHDAAKPAAALKARCRGF